ncbi:hypothetical protein [uncultured Cohaesibacter sp.]|uniref:hypothetical protein n=1 Tax=uncultured Cohaesibacter sp. TaxID=1002546 RepID=UPI00293016D1|nr:hypothetical protein [uncultured Cohaesibacter sp.]
MFYVLIGIVVTTVALLVFNHDAGEVFGYPIETVGSVALLSTLLLFLLSGRNQRKGTILKSVKYLFMWLLVGLALMLGYSFKDEAKILVNRVASELLPGSGVVANNGEVSFRRTLDGHFQVQADINGSTIPHDGR